MRFLNTFLNVRKVSKEAVASLLASKSGEGGIASGTLLNSPVICGSILHCFLKGQTAKSSYPAANHPSLSLIYPRRRIKPDLSKPEIFEVCFATLSKTLGVPVPKTGRSQLPVNRIQTEKEKIISGLELATRSGADLRIWYWGKLAEVRYLNPKGTI